MKWIAIALTFSVLLLNNNCSPIGNGTGYGLPDVVDDLNPLLATDPLNVYAWHIQSRGQTSYSTYPATRGIDMNMLSTIADGIDGAGIRVCVVDSGVESTHEDLAANMIAGGSVDYSTMSWGTSADPIDDDDNHGTDVAGLIAAVAGNGKGSRGIASGAQLASKNLLSANVTVDNAVLVDVASGNFDVFNYSWGSSIAYTFLELESFFEAQLLDSVTNGRAGKGSVFVKAAGNEFQYDIPTTQLTRHANANFDGYNTTPYTIVVGAVNAAGVKASYASSGSSLWTTAPSGQSDYPQMITTDRSGCNKGYANIAYAGYVPTFNLVTSTLNPSCRYDIAFNGTSAATPVVAGAVALMLDANSALTWRDVKHILATTSRKVASSTSSYANAYVPSPSGHVWEQGWVTNGAGYHYSNYFGFGMVDVDAAIAAAKTYVSGLGTFVQTTGGLGNWDFMRSGLSKSIPDNSATGVSDTMAVVSPLTIEAVQLRVEITHADIGQLGIELTSPAGTKSIIMNVNSALYQLTDYLGEVLISNAFYGEPAMGNWTIKIIDGAATTTGTLAKWELRFSGH